MIKVLNKCCKCGQDIEIEVPGDRTDKYSVYRRFKKTRKAQCNECNPKSNWKVVK